MFFMSTNTKIASDIFGDLSFTDDELSFIQSVFSKVNYKKGEVLIHAGDLVSEHYYIQEGCLRSYHIDAHGKEYTVQFGVKDWWISDYTSFFLNTNAVMSIEVLRDATLYRISKKDKELLYTKIPSVESFFRKKLERAFGAFQKRILENLSLTAKERYLRFLERYPSIEKCVKNYHIASYLGITTESLSRIRKELSQE